MSSKMIFGLLALLFAAGLARAQQSALHADTPVTPPAASKTSAPNTAPESAAPEVLAERTHGLSLKQRISQLMLVTMQSSNAPTSDDLAFLKAYTPGGVIIRQILQPASAVVYIAKMRGAEAISGLPLLIGADVYELTTRERDAPSVFIDIPPLLSVAAAGDTETAARLAGIWAGHLSGMGFNFCLGPNLQLAPTLSEALGTIHCLGSNPAFAAEAAGAMIASLKERGIVPMPMGFPGGGTNHTPRSPSVLLTPKPQLAANDLMPYMRAIENGVEMLHVGNTLTPTLDIMSRPASVSKAVMGDLLRGELGYQGVIVAGPMDSEDIAKEQEPVTTSVEALNGGADMLYWRAPVNTVMRAVDGIEHAVNTGALSEETINQAFERVVALKQSLVQRKRPEASERGADMLSKKGDLARDARLVDIRAVTLVQNRNNVLPLDKKRSMPVGVTGVVGVETIQQALEKRMKPVSAQVITTAQHLGEIQDFEIERITSRIRGFRTVVCVFTNSLRPEGQAKLITELKSRDIQVVVLLLGYPRNLAYFTAADAILLGYCDPVYCEQTLLSMADVLLGQAPVSIVSATADAAMRVGEKRVFDARELVRTPPGRLPVNISEAYPMGLGLSYDVSLGVKKAEWDFGTGARSKEMRAEYVFEKPGEYPVKLTIVDKRGEEVSRVFNVTVHE